MELMHRFWVVLCVLVHSTHEQICTQSLIFSAVWWKTLSRCNHGQPLSFTDPPAPAPRAARWLCEGKWTKSQEFTHRISAGYFNPETAKKGDFTQPTITRRGSAQEKRPICLKTHGSELGKKEMGRKSTFGFQLPGWPLEGTSSTLWWSELSQIAASTEEKRLGSAGLLPLLE